MQEWIDDLRAVALAYRESPESEENWTAEEARAFIERDLAERVEAEAERKPSPTPRPEWDEDDGEDGPPLLKDAW